MHTMYVRVLFLLKNPSTLRTGIKYIVVFVLEDLRLLLPQLRKRHCYTCYYSKQLIPKLATSSIRAVPFKGVVGGGTEGN